MRTFLLTSFALLFLSASAHAQSVGTSQTGAIMGTVTDTTGAPVDEVEIEVVGPTRRTTATTPEGAFQIENLSPGTYRLTAAREGFSVYDIQIDVTGTRQELAIELGLAPFTEFVETVSRIAEESARAPFLVTEVDAEELRETGAVTLDEALRTVAGLQHATQGNAFTRVATRGLRDTRDVLVLLDGAPFRQLNGSADLTMIPVPMLQGVEFVKGGASSVYGRGAVGGVMQFFTVPRATREPSAEVVYSIGSFSTHEGQATVNAPYTGGRFAVAASASRSDGHQRDTGRDTNFLSFVNDYAFTDQSNLRMHYLVSDVDARRGSIVPLENGRPMFGITREDNFGIPDARFEGRLHSATGKADVAPNSNFLVTNSFNFNRYERFSTGGITIVPPPTTRTKGWFQGDSTQDTWLNDTMVQWDAGTAQVQNTFMAGLGFEWGDQQQVSPSFSSGATFLGPDYVNPVRNAANGPKGIERPGSTSDFQQSIVSLYAQDRIQAGRVAGTAGLRWDRFDQELRRSNTGVVSSFTGSKVSPRAGVTVNLTENRPVTVAAFGNVTYGFRPQFPSLSTSRGVVIAQLLKPEVTRSIESGVRLQHRSFSAQVAAFNMRKIDGQRSFRTGPETFLFVNATTRVRGVEGEVQVQLPTGHRLFANYAFHNARHLEFRTRTSNFDGFQLRMSPRHIAGAGATLYIERVAWTTSLSYVGSRPLRDNVVNPQILPSYTVLSSAVSSRVGPVRVVLSATNLTDEFYIADDFSSQNAGNPGVPRRVALQIRYNLFQ